jgi:hypothetical protein
MSAIKRYKEIISNVNRFPIVIDYKNEPSMMSSNGQSWNRRNNEITKNHKIVVIPMNKNIDDRCYRYLDPTDDDRSTVNDIIKDIPIMSSNKIFKLIVLGHHDKPIKSRQPFSKKVKEEIFERDNGKCVFCGTKHNVVVDHKDDLYESVGILKAQHGQMICGHHNVLKRGGNSCKRKSRCCPPFLKVLSKYVDKSLDFWKDPYKWVGNVVDIIEDKDISINKLKKTNDILENELKDKDIIISKLLDQIKNKK